MIMIHISRWIQGEGCVQGSAQLLHQDPVRCSIGCPCYNFDTALFIYLYYLNKSLQLLNSSLWTLGFNIVWLRTCGCYMWQIIKTGPTWIVWVGGGGEWRNIKKYVAACEVISDDKLTSAVTWSFLPELHSAHYWCRHIKSSPYTALLGCSCPRPIIRSYFALRAPGHLHSAAHIRRGNKGL